MLLRRGAFKQKSENFSKSLKNFCEVALFCKVTAESSEAATQRCSWEKVFWKYAAIGVLRCSIKLQSNFTEIALRHGCSPVNLLHIFRTPFPKNTSGQLLLKAVIYYEKELYLWCCRSSRSASGRRLTIAEVEGQEAMNFFKNIFRFCLDFKDCLLIQCSLFRIYVHDLMAASCKFTPNSHIFTIQLKICWISFPVFL